MQPRARFSPVHVHIASTPVAGREGKHISHTADSFRRLVDLFFRLGVTTPQGDVTMSGRVFDEGGDKWESILGGVGLSGKSVGLEGWRAGEGGGGHVAGRPAGASTSLLFLLRGMSGTCALHQPTNQFFQRIFDQMTDKAPP